MFLELQDAIQRKADAVGLQEVRAATDARLSQVDEAAKTAMGTKAREATETMVQHVSEVKATAEQRMSTERLQDLHDAIERKAEIIQKLTSEQALLVESMGQKANLTQLQDIRAAMETMIE